MPGYVARKGERFYAVIYEGIDPLTVVRVLASRRHRPRCCGAAGRRSRRPTPRRPRHERGGLTLAVYLIPALVTVQADVTSAKQWDSYRRIIDLHVVPRRADPISDIFGRIISSVSTPTCSTHGRADGTGGLNNKTVVEIHMIFRRALADAVRRGLSCPTPPPSPTLRDGDHCRAPPRGAWTAPQLAAFLTSTRDHRYHAASLGHRQHGHATRRDPRASAGATSTSTPPTSPSPAHSCPSATSSTRLGGKSRTARRPINLDPLTVNVLDAWRQHRDDEDPEFDFDDPDATSSPDPTDSPTHPQLLSDVFPKTRAPIRPPPNPLP